jgi:hypothetical protein
MIEKASMKLEIKNWPSKMSSSPIVLVAHPGTLLFVKSRTPMTIPIGIKKATLPSNVTTKSRVATNS